MRGVGFGSYGWVAVVRCEMFGLVSVRQLGLGYGRWGEFGRGGLWWVSSSFGLADSVRCELVRLVLLSFGRVRSGGQLR